MLLQAGGGERFKAAHITRPLQPLVQGFHVRLQLVVGGKDSVAHFARVLFAAVLAELVRFEAVGQVGGVFTLITMEKPQSLRCK